MLYDMKRITARIKQIIEKLRSSKPYRGIDVWDFSGAECNWEKIA